MLIEYFDTMQKNSKCNISRNINSIDGAILYKDSENEIYHYFFKNVNIENVKYLAFSKCRLYPDIEGTKGDYLKLEPTYPKICNYINIPGLYFSENTYKEPKYISSIFTISKESVEDLLEIKPKNNEIIVAIQDKLIIFCTFTKRLVSKPLYINDIWPTIKKINSAIVNSNGKYLYIFSDQDYYKISLPLKKQYKKNEIKKKEIKSKWKWNFGNNCLNIDAIVNIYSKNNVSSEYYIFQNEKYIRYKNIKEKNENSFIQSDITYKFAEMIYGQLIFDLKGTENEISENYIKKTHEPKLKKNKNNIHDIIKQCAKKKIQLYKNTGDEKYLVLKFDNPIDLNENIIISYKNIVKDYNKVDLPSTSEKCDKLSNDEQICINSILHNNKNYYHVKATLTSLNSGNIIIDISEDFELENVTYVKTYPLTIKESLSELFRGNNLQSENIYNILLNLSDSSSNLGIDSVIYVNDLYYFYKNYTTDNSNSFVKYTTAEISNFTFIKKNESKIFPVINLSLNENEFQEEFDVDDINTAGNMTEIISLCKKKDNIYYIFGKVKNSEICRVLEYDSNTKTVEKYANKINTLFKNVENINNLIVAFNLDPDNTMGIEQSILCFIISSSTNIVKIVTNHKMLEQCDNNCLESQSPEFKKIYNVYNNFKKIKELDKINAVIYEKNNLFVFKQNKCERYENMNTKDTDIEYDEHDMTYILKDGFGIRKSYLQECECLDLIKIVPPKIDIDTSDFILDKIDDIFHKDVLFGLYCTFLTIILAIYYYYSHIKVFK